MMEETRHHGDKIVVNSVDQTWIVVKGKTINFCGRLSKLLKVVSR